MEASCNGCHITKKIHAKGLCSSCYGIAYHNNGLVIKKNDRDFQKYKAKIRLLKNVKIDVNGCWIWQKNYHNNYPYGRVNFKFIADKEILHAHRASYIVFKGDIPENLSVLHSCDVPQCLNPEHLHLGTQADNMKEMKDRKRTRGTVENIRKKFHYPNDSLLPKIEPYNANQINVDKKLLKLNEIDVFKIRKLNELGFGNNFLKDLYDVTARHIRRVISSERWSKLNKEQLCN